MMEELKKNVGGLVEMEKAYNLAREVLWKGGEKESNGDT